MLSILRQMEEFLIKSETEMEKFGEKFVARLLPSGTLALVGDLGAGKTHFTKGLARGLGYEDCSSPTFTIVNEMTARASKLFHFDFYRIKEVEELWDLGWEDYLEREAVVVAEWANLYPELFPENTIWVKIAHEGINRRVFIKGA